MSQLVDNLHKVPPQNLDAESAVLGAVLFQNDAVNRVLEILTPTDFYRESHRIIFSAMIELSERNEPVDLIMLSENLQAKGLLEAVGGSAYIASLDNLVPTAANIAQYARIVKTTAESRRLVRFLQEAEEAIYSKSEDPADIAARLGSFAAGFSNGASNSFVHISDVTVTAVKEIEKAYQSRNPITGIPTGLKDIDNRLGGFHRRETVVIAGRPSMGKTALAVRIANGAAKRGYTVAFVTAESPAPKIVTRMLSEATGIENRNLRRGLLNDAEISTLTDESKGVSALPIYLLDSDRKWDRIKAKIRSLKLKDPALALIVLDYVGLFHAPTGRGERHLEIGRISSEAKELAMELNLAGVLLSQLNREVENLSDKRPRLSHLRESGNLEQDADVVGLLFRPSYYDEPGPADVAQLDIAKNRDGATGIIKLRFDENTVSFSDWNEPTVRDFKETAAGNGGY